MLPTPDDIKTLLEETLKKGARAPQLNAKHHTLRDLLSPAAENESRTDLERAGEAERLLRGVIEDIGGDRASFLLTLLHLSRGAPEQLTERYHAAGKYVGVKERAARTHAYKGTFLEELALQLHNRLVNGAPTRPPAP